MASLENTEINLDQNPRDESKSHVNLPKTSPTLAPVSSSQPDHHNNPKVKMEEKAPTIIINQAKIPTPPSIDTKPRTNEENISMENNEKKPNLVNTNRVQNTNGSTTKEQDGDELNYKKGGKFPSKYTNFNKLFSSILLLSLIVFSFAFFFNKNQFESSLFTKRFFFKSNNNNTTMAPHSNQTTNQTSIKPPGPISPTLQVPEGFEVATFAAGCFWGVEHVFRKYHGNLTLPKDSEIVQTKAIYDCRVGYSGGPDASSNPTYKQVCTNTTGHAESLQVVYDPSLASYETLVDFFFRIHDPTTKNQQGPDDFGEQYRSVIFTHNESQKQIAEKVKEKYQREWFSPVNMSITTEILPIHVFWDAEDYHQLYLQNNPTGYQCPSHFLRTGPPKGPEIYKKRDEK